MIKVILKYLSFVCLLSSISLVKAQLPYVQNSLCLDKQQPIGDTVKPTKNMVIADFNGDTLLDFVIADLNMQQLKVYKALGFGLGYALVSSTTLSGIGLNNSISSGDYDKDGDEDIAICYNGNLKILTNNSFVFNLAQTIPILTSYSPSVSYLQTADFDNDSKDDILLVGSHVNTNYGVAVLCYKNTSMNTSSISFNLDYQKLIFYGLPNLSITNKIDFAVGDINGDLKLDIAFTYPNKLDSMVILQYNNASTILGFNESRQAILPSVASFGYEPLQCAMGDINNDGKQDLISYSEKSSTNLISVFFGSSTGLSYITSFNIPFTSSVTLKDFKLKDINDDGYIDFVGITGLGLVIYLQDGANSSFNNFPPIFALASNILLSEEMEVEDFDNNSVNDIFIKTWKGNRAIPVVIPNFSYKNYITNKGTVICGNSSAGLIASSNVTVSPLIIPTYNWYSVGTTSIIVTSPSITVNSQNNYYYNLQFQFPYTAGTSCLLKSDTISIIVSAVPSISITPFTSTTVCSGTTINLLASGAQTFTWNGTNAFPSFTTTTTSNTTYTVEGTDSYGCIGTNTVIVNLHAQNTNKIIATKNPICVGDSITLSFLSTTSYTWSNGIINKPGITVNPTTNTTYSLSYEYGNNCISDKTIDILIDPSCEQNNTLVYNAITPNNDGNNDAFFIEDIEKYVDNQISIYNRWGGSIITIKKYNNTTNFWPKKDDYAHLVSGTYFYILNYGNGKVRKGWIELINN